jgi:hypothetical protein
MRAPRKWVLMGVLVVGAAMALFLLAPRERPLLSIATRVNVPGGLQPDTYKWLSNSELLVSRPDDSAERVNLSTGTREPLTALNRRLTSSTKSVFRPTDWMWYSIVSPDGTLLLRALTDRADNPWTVDSLDGSKHVEYKAVRQVWTAAWLPDSRGFVGLSRRFLTLCSATSDKPVRKVTLPPLLAGPDRAMLGVAGTTLVVIDTACYGPPGDAVRLFTADLGSQALAPVEHVLRPPQRAVVRLARLSPPSAQGTYRLAWLLDRPTRRPGPAFMREFYALMGHKWVDRVDLYVSNVDGRDMRFIGYFEYQYTKDALSSLFWTPDGTCLSFIYHNSLWTVPVD